MSKWASPIVVVPKKSAPGEPPKRRLCVDFRKVNKLQQEVITAGKTKGQISIHPLPKIDEMYAKLKGAKVFSTIDLRSGYHHIVLGKSSRAKTAFVTPFGKYEFLMLPFGLAQAPAYFQFLMNKVLKGLKFATTSHGHCYALTAVCMLTGFTWCVPLKTKTAEEVAKAYMDHIYCNFGGSIKILTDNGTEFKNKLFKEVVNKLGMEFSIHSPPY